MIDKYHIGWVSSGNKYGDYVITGFGRIGKTPCAYIKFLDTGFDTRVRFSQIRKGTIKDPMKPVVMGVGFMGVGIHSSSKSPLAHRCWGAMMTRCYNERYRKKYPTYEGCSVSNEWHNFQNFAKWYYENKPKCDGDFELDKDIKVNGNKVYGERFCIFVTPKENSIKAHRKALLLKTKGGTRVLIKDVLDFEKITGISAKSLRRVQSGERRIHKGWAKA